MQFSFKWIGAATWILKVGSATIACDPCLCPKGTIQNYGLFRSKRITPPVFNTAEFDAVDFWLITHTHLDHLDTDGQSAIRSGKVIAPEPIEGIDDAIVLNTGGMYMGHIADGESISITAFPMMHTIHPMLSGLMGRGHGYIISFTKDFDNLTIYVSGDTIPDAKTLTDLSQRRIDVAILNAGQAKVGLGLLGKILGRITMNREDILRFAQATGVRTILPVHWGSFSHYSELLTEQDFTDCTTVRLIQNGETIELESESE